MNDENLKPFHTLSESEQRAIRSKGGKRSGEVRRERKKIRELAEIIAQLPNEETGEQNDIAMVLAMFKKAIAGDVSAFIALRDTLGEKPKDVIENVNPPTINIGDVKI